MRDRFSRLSKINIWNMLKMYNMCGELWGYDIVNSLICIYTMLQEISQNLTIFVIFLAIFCFIMNQNSFLKPKIKTGFELIQLFFCSVNLMNTALLEIRSIFNHFKGLWHIIYKQEVTYRKPGWLWTGFHYFHNEFNSRSHMWIS